MKKRAQRPDSHTFTILLRGLADYTHFSQTLSTALQLYHSISAENSKVQANIIHTNALLKICSRAGDLDSMWDIASKLPERGSYAANAWTFTTFLQTMREQAISKSQVSDLDTGALHREEMIVQGRKLWAVIVIRWRQGDFMLDEELVCAMGRLLLIGSRPRDWDDVLSLIQQSMAIPRQVPALGTQARKDGGQVRIRTKTLPQGLRDANLAGEGDEEDASSRGMEFEDTFGLANGQKAPSSSSLARAHSRVSSLLARPSNNTLSLLLEATLKTLAVDAGLSYWRLLTNPDEQFVITPDSENVHMLLRLLRQNRASTAATNILHHDMRELQLPYLHKTFRIAMSACVRDATNENVMDNAEKILDIMVEKNPEHAHLSVLTQYIDVANKYAEHAAKYQKVSDKSSNVSSAGGSNGSPRFDVAVIVRAIKRLRPYAIDALQRARAGLKSSSTANDPADEAPTSDPTTPAAITDTVPRARKHTSTTSKSLNDLDTILELERSLIGLHDRVIDAVREARTTSTAKDADFAPWGVTGEMLTRYKRYSGGFTSAVSTEANKRLLKDDARVRDAKAKDMRARRLLRQAGAKIAAESAAQASGGVKAPVEERTVKHQEEQGQEEVYGKRKWTPGVKPKSGIARAFAVG